MRRLTCWSVLFEDEAGRKNCRVRDQDQARQQFDPRTGANGSVKGIAVGREPNDATPTGVRICYKSRVTYGRDRVEYELLSTHRGKSKIKLIKNIRGENMGAIYNVPHDRLVILGSCAGRDGHRHLDVPDAKYCERNNLRLIRKVDWHKSNPKKFVIANVDDEDTDDVFVDLMHLESGREEYESVNDMLVWSPNS